MTQNSINNTASIFDVDNLNLDANTISSTDTNGNIVLAPDGSGVVSVTTAPIVPSGDRADSLGSATNSWDNVYCDGVSFDDGTTTLAEYEISTFTPVLEFGGGSTGITYDVQSGRYTKIGAIIQFNIVIDLSAKGSSTGDAIITGLPYTSANDGAEQIINLSGSTLSNTSGDTQFYGLVSANTSQVELRNCGDSSDEAITNAEFSDTTIIYLTGFYWDA
jgi:hypothetical protein